MTPEISEFSYGFALTNKIVGWGPLRAAPIFPNLIEEGRAGGGYDVKLDTPAVALYLQFKRADCLTRRSAREIAHHGLNLAVPFHRFPITEQRKSNQHELLLALDDGVNAVFYAAPRFHEIAEINSAWANNSIASRSIFVRPADIGSLGTGSYHVSYDDWDAFLCSEPRELEFLTSAQLVAKLSSRLENETRALSDSLPELLQGQQRARERAAHRERDQPSGAEAIADSTPKPPRAPDRVPTRQAKELDGARTTLRELADNAAKVFDAQLVIVQRAGDHSEG